MSFLRGWGGGHEEREQEGRGEGGGILKVTCYFRSNLSICPFLVDLGGGGARGEGTGGRQKRKVTRYFRCNLSISPFLGEG